MLDVKVTHTHSLRRVLLAALGLPLTAALLLAAGCYYALVVRPEVGAEGADMLRRVLGQEPVAQLETTLYTSKDQIDRGLADVGLKQPEAPWQEVPAAQASVAAPTAQAAPGVDVQKVQSPEIPAPIPLPEPAWLPPTVPPLGSLSGEGQWEPYLFDGSGRAVAYRTFVAPDPLRRYVVVALVVFDLHATQLHFVLGSDEPKSAVALARSGHIPAADALPGTLLSVFNGGFKADHGQFGAMADRVVVLPAIPGHMTVAGLPDGALRMGDWGRDLTASDDALWWRQNGPPIIDRGEVNPLTAETSGHNWGASISGTVTVWRSGLGLSQDGRSLYYAAGDNLMASTLARSLAAVGAYNAMQLDVNNYWVYFGAVRSDGARLVNDTLFEKMKSSDPRRYLNGFSRDFFYVTLRQRSTPSPHGAN